MYTIVVSSTNERAGKGRDDVSVGFQSESESESELLYGWRFTANQFVLATSHLRLTTIISFSTGYLLS
jgi:hypothetical protein